jgi:hypothetical protein
MLRSVFGIFGCRFFNLKLKKWFQLVIKSAFETSQSKIWPVLVISLFWYLLVPNLAYQDLAQIECREIKGVDKVAW